MINYTKRKEKFLTPEKAATFLPVLISSFISIFIIIFFAIPQYNKSNKVNSELSELKNKKDNLENLKLQYRIINQKFSKVNKEKAMLIELISGTSNLETLLSKLGELSKRNNIKFVSIIPKEIKPFINANVQQNNNAKVNLILDPFLVEGTKKYLIEFTFKTEFINLLSFLRELEFQENLILLDDIKIKLNNEKIKKNEGKPLYINLIMTTYGKL